MMKKGANTTRARQSHDAFPDKIKPQDDHDTTTRQPQDNHKTTTARQPQDNHKTTTRQYKTNEVP
jgi:hypothetical protein